MIERCLAQAGLEPSAWRQSVPEPPVRLSQSDYRRMNTRVFLENVSLKQVAALAHHLHEADSTLEVSAVNLTNRDSARETATWSELCAITVSAVVHLSAMKLPLTERTPSTQWIRDFLGHQTTADTVLAQNQQFPLANSIAENATTTVGIRATRRPRV